MHSNALQLARSQRNVRTLGVCVRANTAASERRSHFGPEDIKLLSTVFEEALRELRLVDRTDPATQLVAKRIIELAQQGERDPIRLREGAIKGI